MKKLPYAFFLFFFISLVFTSMGTSLAGPEEPLLVGCHDSDRVLLATEPAQKGPDVEELQERLKELGYYPGSISGIYDYPTQRAVIRFHRDHGMGSSTMVTLETWELLAQNVTAPPAPDKNLKDIDGDMEIVIDKNTNRLTVYLDGKLFKEYPVAIGKNKTPTPVGEFKVANKSLKDGGALGTRWMGLNVPWGSYGIHGTNKPWSIGRRASAGCIRMFNQHVEELFPLVRIGTPVIIMGDYPPLDKPNLKYGVNSQSLIPWQYRLREVGVYWGPADGRFGAMTALAIKYYQLLNIMEPTGEFTDELYKILEK
ncbi:L,D-transpeptidase family protein [Desulfitibacter alkalitolerans]|uniref:L,D-transpeptidase family protein n=1 Tax=Desulfitibacter alkalitolerans TaxID=264641 RepID=UPI0006888F51|nr:L,D-transpeptidase family protein [Desulfitibacter alkalitolerans]